MDGVDEWIRIVDRTGLLLLSAEGPYIRYGMPKYVKVRRRFGRYEVEWVEDSDGVGASATGHKHFNRAGLEHYLNGLLDDDRPVRQLGTTETYSAWYAIRVTIVFALILGSGIAWIVWSFFVP